jgi:hypothetical protein
MILLGVMAVVIRKVITARPYASRQLHRTRVPLALASQLDSEAERRNASAWDHPEPCLQACCTQSPSFWSTC